MKRNAVYILVFLIAIAVVFFIYSHASKNQESLISLNAKVSTDDSQFKISNRDTFDYLNVKITMNKTYSYVWYGFNLKAGETYTLWKAEFTDKNGRVFPIKQNPVTVTIWCETADGKNGSYYKKWR